jgi:hypothetical protein
MAISVKIINQQLIEQALVAAFEDWASEDINNTHWNEQFRDASRWPYEGETLRKNKQQVSSPRDIYDLGKLYESGVQSFRLLKTAQGPEAKWHWNATNSSGGEYAWYVHEGLGTNVTARPFTDDISIASSFFQKTPGIAFASRVRQSLSRL